MEMERKGVIVTEKNEEYEAINVQIKVTGVDLSNLESTGKVFHAGGREYPMSRFGTWVLQGIRDDGDMMTLLIDGGIVVALIWALSQAHREITAWVNSVHDNRFTLEVKKSQKTEILGEIGSGRMAKKLEENFKTLSNTEPYGNLKVKLVKIIRESDADKKEARKNEPHRFPEAARLNRLAESERVANFMRQQNHSWAFMMLKKSLENEKDEIARLQMLMRLSVCAMHMNNDQEMKASLPEVLHLMKTVDLPAEEIALYQKDYDELFRLLLINGAATLAIEVSFGFVEIVKKIPDASERLDKITMILNHISNFMKLLLSQDPGACLKTEIMQHVKKAADQIGFMQTQTSCDSLVKAQCIYYAEFSLAEVKSALDKQKESIFRESSMHFKRISSFWADLPFVITRLRLHPETSKYLQDVDFCDNVKQICKKPSLLQQKISDSKIARANQILMSEFGIFSSDKDVIETLNNTDLITGATATEVKKDNKIEKPLDKKQEAQKEKERGNEDYKNQKFEEAHAHYDKAIALDPTDALLHSNKAAVFMSQQQMQFAKASCITALKLAQDGDRHDIKDVAKITARLARVEYLDRHPDIALALYQQSLRLNFDPKIQEQMKECEQVVLAIRSMSWMRPPSSQ